MARRKRRIETGDRAELKKRVDKMRVVAQTIVDLDEVRTWALAGVELLNKNLAKLPPAARNLAKAAANIDAPDFNLPDFARLWFEATTRSADYGSLAQQLLDGAFSAPLLAHRIVRVRTAVQLLLSLVPPQFSSRSTNRSIDAVDAVMQNGVSIPDTSARRVRALVLHWNGERAAVRPALRQPAVRGVPPRALLAETYGVDDDTLKKRRSRRKSTKR